MKTLPPLLALLLLSLGGCGPAGLFSPATATPTASPTASETPRPTATATETAVRTPPILPEPYRSDQLNPLDRPHTYLSDTCQMLQDRWASTGSAPGTVVMTIMFHSITSGPVTQDNQMTEADFRALMQALHDQGFQAIRMSEMLAFLETNAPIPPRAVLLIADDRHQRGYFDSLFRPYWTDWGWPVVNAWISTPLNTADLWTQQEDLYREGWVDYQAHGTDIYPLWPGASAAYIQDNLQGSLDAFALHFGTRPIAFIWPGGGFSNESVAAARALGYRLGFTTSPRGPVMFDWVPLADQPDAMRPSWAAEGGAGDPLLLLPRYWDTDAIQHIGTVLAISEQAAAYLEAARATELEYYDIVCAPGYGPIP